MISRNLILSASLLVTTILSADPGKPNILLIFTDDQGYSDLSIQGECEDIRTPFIDSIAHSGVRCTAGYVTAPQCAPSRAGMLTGRYQNRFGLETNRHGPVPLEELTIAERLRALGYRTGMSGKWHLGICNYGPDAGKYRETSPANPYLPPHQGFDEYFCGVEQDYVVSHDLNGQVVEGAPAAYHTDRYRLEAQTDWALSFLERNADQPFFLYVAYYAPHVPLDAPQSYLDRFPGVLEGERKTALAMMSAMDDGVGKILQSLESKGLRENTLVFYISDNGAPHGKGWNGSLNEPLRGAKGSVYEGGVRVPYLVSWPGVLPQGEIYNHPVSSLDVAATAVSVAGGVVDERLDGVNLIPWFRSEKEGMPHEFLFWKWSTQTGLIHGQWKFVKLGENPPELYDLSSDIAESVNLADSRSDQCEAFGMELKSWLDGLPKVPDLMSRRTR